MNYEEEIKACLEQEIRPQIQSHNGDIIFISFKDGVVTVELQGACIGCPLSLYTLKMGVLETLQKKIPKVKSVVDITEQE